MKQLPVNPNTMRSFWLLLLLSIGLFSVEVLLGLLRAPIVPFQPAAALIGLVGFVILAGGVLWISDGLAGLPTGWFNGAFGLAIGSLLSVKLHLSHPLPAILIVALTALLIPFVVRFLDRDCPLGSPIAFLVLFVIGTDWLQVSSLSPAGEIIIGSIGALSAALFTGLVHRYWPAVRKRAWPLLRSVNWAVGLLFVVSVGAWFYWGSPSHGAGNFTGEIPEARLAGETSLKEMPNIILISIDTLRTDRTPPGADTRLRIPHLRRLHRDSVRYEDTISPSNWTLPSHASLFTGLSPIEHGAVQLRGSPIYSKVPLYPQVLKELGYRTAAFTDGGFVNPALGFGRGFEVYRTDYPEVRRGQGFRPGLVVAGQWVIRRLGPSPERPAGSDPGEYRYFWENTRAARRWVRSVKTDENPFFLFLHTYEVHDFPQGYPRSLAWLEENHPSLHSAVVQSSMKSPLERKPLTGEVEKRFSRRRNQVQGQPLDKVFNRLAEGNPESWNVLKWWIATEPEERWARFLDLPVERQQDAFFKIVLGTRRWGIPKSIDLTTNYASNDFFDRVQARYRLDDEAKRELEDFMVRKLQGWRLLYDRHVTRVDETLGEFMRFLKDRGLYEPSLIVFVSDHGEGFSRDPLSLKHGFRDFLDGRAQLHESIIRVPAWIKLPGNHLAGTTCGGLNRLTRVFPTVLALTDVELVNDGSVPSVREEGFSRQNVCSETGRNYVRGSAEELVEWNQSVPRFFVRGRDYKYVRQPTLDVREFWHVEGNIEEEKRVSPEAVPPERRRRLRERMERFRRRFEALPNPYARDVSTLDQKDREKLRGLGYF